MRRISLALALISAVAAGCSGGGKSSSDTGAAPGIQEGTFTVTIQNNGVLAITGGKVTSTPAGIDCGEGVVPQVCSFDFPLGTTVVLTPTAFVPNKLLGWAGDCQGDAGCTLSGNADKYIVVTFGEEGDRTGHPNWSDPVLHAGKYNDFKNGLTGALQCTACHGAALQGQGIAPKCNLCHAMPGLPLPPPPLPVGGVTGYVTSKAGPVAGAKVYLVPTGDVLADSIYTPPEYDAAATYAANALVAHHEGVYQNVSGSPLTAVEPPTDLALRATVPQWQFIAVVHTPHAFSTRNSYRPGDLVIFPKADNTVFSVFEARVAMRGSTDNGSSASSTIPYWTTATTTATVSPSADAITTTTEWEYVGAANALAFFDNLPAWAAKTHVAGALIRDGADVYRTAAGCTSNGTNRAGDTNCAWTSIGKLKNLAVASNVDEPLEGTIREHGYAFATTGADGSYSFTAAQLPETWTGRYYLTVVPTDSVNLPGGDKCRKPLIVPAEGAVANIEVATKPSASASYVGPTKCLTCHSAQNNTKMTAHMLGIQKIFAPSGLQDLSKFPQWNSTQSKFTAGDATSGGTTLYFYGAQGAWSLSENDPGTQVSYTARLYSNGGKFYVELNNVKNPADPLSGGDYQVELSYGGGIYKQRYIAKVKADGTPGGPNDVASRFIIPIQYNYEGVAPTAAAEAQVGNGRWTWNQYNGADWFADNATPALATIKNIATANPHKSFDSMCAGCHFTGYTLDATNNRASAAADVNGDYDYDADGDLDVMNISCESCHGPGSEHVAAGSQASRIVNPALLTPEREVAICSQCHTRFKGIGGVGASVTEAPLNASHKMPLPGVSRKEFLQNHVSAIDDGMWDAKKGNGKYSVKHHQQASDFLTTEKYRNKGVPKGGWSVVAGKEGLGTCSSCHDLHGNTTAPRQLVAPLEMKVGTTTTAGLCTTCHAKNLGGTGHTARGAPSTGTTSHINVTTWTCASCHVPKTAKSGTGAVAGTVGGETFYRGDISSHLFIGVPYVYYAAPAKLPTSAKTGGLDSAGKVDIMPIPYTDACGSCHTQGRANWKDGIQ